MDAAYYDTYARVEDEHWWFAARRRILARVLDGLKLPPDARLLEAGCGTGGNLALLARYGRLDAGEIDARARAYATARGITAVRPLTLPHDVPFEDEAYDVVALLDVLEHVEDDAAALARLFRLLKPGGHLVLTVPAFAFLWSAHDVVNHHFRRYRIGPLVARLRTAGFTVNHATYFNTLLFPAVAMTRLARPLRGFSVRATETIPAAPVNRLLEATFAAERFVAPRLRLPFGVSLLAVARRPG